MKLFRTVRYWVEYATNRDWRRARKSHKAALAAMPERIRTAHMHSSMHREEILGSEKCGCFYCFHIFIPTEITEWVDNGQTALCPYCPVDSVIGSASGYPIELAFLKEMHEYWF